MSTSSAAQVTSEEVTTVTERTLVEAIRDAFDQEMERDERVMILGEDVGVDGGIFRVTDGLLDKYGEDRVVDTPLAESAIVGTALGLAVGGMRPCAELQFSGFSYQAFHQVEQHVARYRKRTQGRVTLPMVIRMPYGAGVRALEHHSESREAYYAHTPGLKVVMPSSPRKGFLYLKAAIRDDEPVVFLEPKLIYRKYRQEMDDEEEPPEIGPAEVEQEGDDLTLVAWGAMQHVARAACDAFTEESDATVERIDLPTVAPLDSDTIVQSVKKTGRCVVVHEAPRTLGLGAEIAARINEEALLWLEAPVKRVTGYDVHPPLFAREQGYMPDERKIIQAMHETLDF